MSKQYFIYILTNKSHVSLYTGITSDLQKRIYQHKNKLIDGYTKQYNCSKLVYYEVYEDPENAISREKQLKKWRRDKKDYLINIMNPNWNDLYDGLF